MKVRVTMGAMAKEYVEVVASNGPCLVVCSGLGLIQTQTDTAHVEGED